MPEQDSMPVGAILDTWSDDPWTNGVQIDHREDMEKLAIRTWNSLYEITIIEGRSGEILLRGGQSPASRTRLMSYPLATHCLGTRRPFPFFYQL
jgi:hypothetical protein